MNVPPACFLLLAAVLFAIGALGAILRRNVLIALMSIELMLNAANITLVAFSKMHHLQGMPSAMRGQGLAFLTIAVAGAEAAVGLAIIVGLFRNRRSTNLDELTVLKY